MEACSCRPAHADRLMEAAHGDLLMEAAHVDLLMEACSCRPAHGGLLMLELFLSILRLTTLTLITHSCVRRAMYCTGLGK